MRSEEVCVCFFVEILKTHQPKISRHLGISSQGGNGGGAERGLGCTTALLNPQIQTPHKFYGTRWRGSVTIAKCNAIGSD